MAGFSWDTFSNMIQNDLNSINDSFESSLKILNMNPFDNSVVIDPTITSGVKAVSLTLVSLFFVMQFCNEAMYLRLQSYEQILKLMFKFVLAKVLVDNARGLMGIIYNTFNGLVVGISNKASGIMSTFDVASIATKPSEKGWFGFNYLTAFISAMPTILILKGACWVISIIFIGRLFEVIIYSTIAPIPLATFAGEGWSESCKTFIKGYAAVCIQALVIMLMFQAFNAISQLATAGGSRFSITLTALALALGVVKSGQWSRQAVGLG